MAKRKKRATVKTKVRRRVKSFSRRHAVAASAWTIVTSVVTILWLLTGLTLWGVATLLSGLATGLTAVLMFDPDEAVPAPPPQRTAQRSPGETASRASRPKTGTPPRQQAPKAPNTPRQRVCSIRCQTSTRPLRECECSCGGASHGSRRKAAA